MKKKVLVIDDEQDALMLMMLFFKRRGFEVEIAQNLKDGINKIESIHPDIVFMDNKLPDGMGWDKAMDIIKEHPEIDMNLISAYNPQFKAAQHPEVKVWQKPLNYNRLSQEFS